MFISFWTDRSGQTMYTQIVQEQSDQGGANSVDPDQSTLLAISSASFRHML